MGNNTEVLETKCLSCKTRYDAYCYLCENERNVRKKQSGKYDDMDMQDINSAEELIPASND